MLRSLSTGPQFLNDALNHLESDIASINVSNILLLADQMLCGLEIESMNARIRSRNRGLQKLANVQSRLQDGEYLLFVLFSFVMYTVQVH